jgi:hypothetical protein
MAAPVKRLSIWNDDACDGDGNGGAPDAHEIGGFHFQADAEQEEHDAELGEDAEELGGLHPAEDMRADQNSGDDFADDAGLAEAFEELGQELGGSEDDEKGQRDIGGSTAGDHDPLWPRSGVFRWSESEVLSATEQA